MSKNKWIRMFCLSLAALFLFSSVAFASETEKDEPAEPQDIIDVEQFLQEQGMSAGSIYETAVVERGTFSNEIEVSSMRYYPYTYNLKFENGNAKFKEFKVRRGDEVKKGDVLATFTIDQSQAELTRLKLNLQRMQETTESGIREREQSIEQVRAELAAATEAYDREVLGLTLKKMEIELEQFKYSQQYYISQEQKAYNEEYDRRTTDTIVSPVDGVVESVAEKDVDEAVSPSEVLITINAGESELYAVLDSGLRYNMPVEVKVYGARNAVTMPGRVVAADDAIPAAERTGYALIQLDPYEGELATRENYPLVLAETVRLEEVLLVPYRAVSKEPNVNYQAITLEEEVSYVQKLNDEALQKRYVETAIDNMKYMLVLSGVEEGETLILR